MRVERVLVGILCVAATTATGCGGKLAYNIPPAARLMEPGPGVGGPGPGVIPPAGNPYGMLSGGAVNRYGNAMPGGYEMYGTNGPHPGGPRPGGRPMMADSGVMQVSYNCGCENGACSCGESCPCGEAYSCGPECGGAGECEPAEIGAMTGAGMNAEAGVEQTGFHHCHGGRLHGILGGGRGFIRPGSVESYADDAAMAGVPTSQVAFLGDDGVQVSWDVSDYGMFDSAPLVIPGRQDFYQGSIYRLRLTNIPGRPGIELYPTLEIAPVTPRTDAYLAHSPIPVQFTEEDFDQVTSGNFVTKVIYLPDPEFQELALAGVETLVSTRLGPGVDPIAEADRRGSILAILRMGNKDLRRGGATVEYEPEVVPASHEAKSGAKSKDAASYESQALYKTEVNAAGEPAASGVVPAQYCGPYGDGMMADGSMAMPMGTPTSGFAPPNVPPNMLAGGPQWGMPITGTPIGLPGPPHVPLGVPAGLQKHVMKNRTRVMLPPPVAKVKLSVKQRPGLNYPRPVNHVHVDETQREPVRLMPGWLSGLFAGRGGGAHGPADCQ
ncbi:MAG: hypothetical protein L0228_03755 [Planctomycetes bacterium]|nr:hypothetical protein [Planctomycetota bacterium]